MLKSFNEWLANHEPWGVLIAVVALVFTVYFQYQQVGIWQAESNVRAEERAIRAEERKARAEERLVRM